MQLSFCRCVCEKNNWTNLNTGSFIHQNLSCLSVNTTILYDMATLTLIKIFTSLFLSEMMFFINLSTNIFWWHYISSRISKPFGWILVNFPCRWIICCNIYTILKQFWKKCITISRCQFPDNKLFRRTLSESSVSTPN